MAITKYPIPQLKDRFCFRLRRIRIQNYFITKYPGMFISLNFACLCIFVILAKMEPAKQINPKKEMSMCYSLKCSLPKQQYMATKVVVATIVPQGSESISYYLVEIRLQGNWRFLLLTGWTQGIWRAFSC